MIRVLLGSLLIVNSILVFGGVIYETDKTRNNINVNTSYSSYESQKKIDESQTYINKIDPLFSYIFFDDSSPICPGWLKGEKKYETKTVEICWRPSKPLIEMKLKWQYGSNSSFLLMPEKLLKINFGNLDFYNQPVKTQECLNYEGLTINQIKNQVNFTNYDESVCSQQGNDNVTRDRDLCRLPMEKKYNQYSYLNGEYYGTKIGFNSINHLSKTNRDGNNLYQKYFSKFSSKYSITEDDEIYLGYGVLNRTSVISKDKKGTTYISTEGLNKPISVICILNKDRDIKTIDFFEN